VEFEFDEDQRLLRQSVRETLAKTRDLSEAGQWSTYLELGWLEAPPVELAIIAEELGYVADPTPFLATATWFLPLAGRLPESGGGADGTGAGGADGDGTGADRASVFAGAGTGVFDGAGRYVLDADRASEIALLTDDGVRVVPAAEVTAERIGTFDQRLHVAHVTTSAGAGISETGRGSGGPSLVRRVPDLALTGLAATTVGACRRILDLTVEYVKQRHQFGVPIGSFQAVKHKAADMYVAIERARALAYFAALTLAEDDPRAHRAALMAKAAAGECQQVVFANGLQLHGAIGFTWENELQYYLKRAAAGDLLLGTASVHRRALLTLGAQDSGSQDSRPQDSGPQDSVKEAA
jgi:alkylation response protein AidB-like acyl-CoA dehydrogenase